MDNTSELSSWMKDLILKFREEHNKLSDKEKKQLGNIDNLNKPCQVESFWIRDEELNYDFQFHFFTKFENEKDLKIKVNVLNSQNYVEFLDEYVKEEKWNRLLSDCKSSVDRGNMKYSDMIERFLATGIDYFRYIPLNSREHLTPCFIMKILINPDTFCWSSIGKIQENKVEKEVNSIMSHIKRGESEITVPTSKTEITDGFGTFFYPPIWIGTYPKPTLKDRVNKKKLIDFTKKIQDVTYKNKILIVNNDGFIAIEGKNKKESTNLLNEIMATATLLDIPASMINESELGKVSIDLENRVIRNSDLPVNSMRTNLFHAQWEKLTDIKFNRAELSKNEISKLFSTAEKITNDKNFKNFLIFYLESFTHFQNYLYSQSFIMSWLIIERYLSQLWKKEVVDKKTKGKQKRSLKQRDRWSTYYIIETLTLLGIIKTNEKYNTLMRLKRKRDHIVHQGEQCSKEEAEECLNLAKILLPKN